MAQPSPGLGPGASAQLLQETSLLSQIVQLSQFLADLLPWGSALIPSVQIRQETSLPDCTAVCQSQIVQLCASDSQFLADLLPWGSPLIPSVQILQETSLLSQIVQLSASDSQFLADVLPWGSPLSHRAPVPIVQC